jgi:hypothetical protein
MPRPNTHATHRSSNPPLVTLFFRDADSAGYERSPEAEHPMFVTGRAKDAERSNGTPTTTRGASSGPGMRQDLVAQFPTEGRFAFWPETRPDGPYIYKRSNSPGSD